MIINIYTDLYVDYLKAMDPVEYLKRSDPVMNEIILRVGKFSMKMKKDPFLSLIESIIFQQLGGKAAKSIYIKFVTHYKNHHPTPREVLATHDQTLRSFGFSTRKIEYVKLLSRGIHNGEIQLDDKSFQNMNDFEIVSSLTKIKGIGLWTAEMFMIFFLGRLDVFPVKDIGIKKAIQRWYFPNSKSYPTEDKMAILSRRWIPFRSIATWYLWKSFSNFDNI